MNQIMDALPLELSIIINRIVFEDVLYSIKNSCSCMTMNLDFEAKLFLKPHKNGWEVWPKRRITSFPVKNIDFLNN